MQGLPLRRQRTTLSLAQEYPFLYAAVGVHPSDVSGMIEMRTLMHGSKEQTTLQRQLRWERSDWIITGIRNRRYRRSRGIGLDGSLNWLNRQTNLPVIIHSRDAAEDTMQIMKKVHEDGYRV